MWSLFLVLASLCASAQQTIQSDDGTVTFTCPTFPTADREYSYPDCPLSLNNLPLTNSQTSVGYSQPAYNVPPSSYEVQNGQYTISLICKYNQSNPDAPETDNNCVYSGDGTAPLTLDTSQSQEGCQSSLRSETENSFQYTCPTTSSRQDVFLQDVNVYDTESGHGEEVVCSFNIENGFFDVLVCGYTPTPNGPVYYSSSDTQCPQTLCNAFNPSQRRSIPEHSGISQRQSQKKRMVRED